MTVNELIEKQLPKWRTEFRPQIREQLKDFAEELLRSIEPTREQATKANGCYFRALDSNYWKALEELRK